MEAINNHRASVIVAAAIVALLGLALLGDKSSTAQGNNEAETSQSQNENKNENQQQTENSEQTESTTDAQYVYVAQPGDSYSVLARKAVQTFGIVEKVTLSQAQILAAETQLTNQAGSPALTIGQEVTIDPSAVNSAIDMAENLSAEDQAAWESYVQFVDFNTDANGEARS